MNRTNFYATFLFMGLILATTCNVFTKADDSYSDRKVVDKIVNQNGIILKISDNYLIALDSLNSGTRYFPCNLADEFKLENETIKFSGKVKEIFPNERLMGTPFVITNCSN